MSEEVPKKDPRPVILGLLDPENPGTLKLIQADFDDVAYFRQQGGAIFAFCPELDGDAIVHEPGVTLDGLQARGSDMVPVTLFTTEKNAKPEELRRLVHPGYVRDIQPNTHYPSAIVAAWNGRPYFNPLIQEIHIETRTPRHLPVEGTLEDVVKMFMQPAPGETGVQPQEATGGTDPVAQP